MNHRHAEQCNQLKVFFLRACLLQRLGHGRDFEDSRHSCDGESAES